MFRKSVDVFPNRFTVRPGQPELFQIIARTRGVNMTDQRVEALSYYERCSMLNRNPVVVAKHFQHRVETFFKEVLMTNANPIGKIIYYALRIEFLMRGSPHLHALMWTSDCPKLTYDNIQAYTEFEDNHVQAYLPNKEADPKLHELVATYQNILILKHVESTKHTLPIQFWSVLHTQDYRSKTSLR